MLTLAADSFGNLTLNGQRRYRAVILGAEIEGTLAELDAAAIQLLQQVTRASAKEVARGLMR